ncbi:MAG: transglutaminase-like domain-containing protein [Candidatus Micrarchaeota archaeon]
MKRLLFLLLFVSSVLAVSLGPKDLQHSIVSMNLTWSLAGEGRGVFKTFSFPETSQQKISLNSDYSFSVQEGFSSNEYLVFSFDGRTEITLRVLADVDYSRSPSKVVDASAFSGESDLVLFDSSISSTAASIVAGVGSDLEKTVLLTAWVHKYLTYDESFWGENKDSITVFNERKGVCVEYSHLLLALLRSQGIPARLVAGWVYSGEEWNTHAWVEAAVNGEWVPLDATFNEAVLLDASHIAFAFGRDQDDIKGELTKGFSSERTESVSIVSNENWSFFEVGFSDFPVDAGSESIIVVKTRLFNAVNRAFALPVSLIVPSSPPELAVSVLSDSEELVFLKPGEEKIVSFKAKLPSLEEGYNYNFSFGLKSLGFFESKVLSASVLGSSNALREIDVSSVDYEVSLTEAKIIVGLKNYFNESVSGTAELSFSNESKQFVIPAGGSINLVFSIPFDSGVNGELSVTALGKTLRKPVILESPPASVIEESEFDNWAFYAILLILLLAVLLLLKRFLF